MSDQKKRVGRPRKRTAVVPIELHGIAAAASSPDNYMELVYCNPKMYKKMFALLKKYVCNEVTMTFTPTELIISSVDHLGKSNICMTVDGKMMNHYFCTGIVKIHVMREQIEKVFCTLDKTHYKITFLLKHNNMNTLEIIIRDSEYDNDDNYSIEILQNMVDDVATKDDDSGYPVKFTMSSKHFKKKIDDISKFSKKMAIQKTADGPLQLSFDEIKNKINYNGVYRSAEKIQLQAILEPDDMFMVSIFIENIKPFSTLNLGDAVTIAADKSKKLSLTTSLDVVDLRPAAVVKVYTDIICFDVL